MKISQKSIDAVRQQVADLVAQRVQVQEEAIRHQASVEDGCNSALAAHGIRTEITHSRASAEHVIIAERSEREAQVSYKIYEETLLVPARPNSAEALQLWVAAAPDRIIKLLWQNHRDHFERPAADPKNKPAQNVLQSLRDRIKAIAFNDDLDHSGIAKRPAGRFFLAALKFYAVPAAIRYPAVEQSLKNFLRRFSGDRSFLSAQI